ncbi:hypothetical protein GCM10009696_35220 [Kocuria himachalensis]
MSALSFLAQHRADPCRPLSLDRAGPSYLRPDEAFPAELGALSMTELQVLHSRMCRQLDREYLTEPQGPHPCTTDRLQDILGELDARDRA